MNDRNRVRSSITTPITQFHSRRWPAPDAVLVGAGQEHAHQVQEHRGHHQVGGDAVHRADPRAEGDDELDVLHRAVGPLDRGHVEEEERQAGEDEQEEQRGADRAEPERVVPVERRLVDLRREPVEREVGDDRRRPPRGRSGAGSSRTASGGRPGRSGLPGAASWRRWPWWACSSGDRQAEVAADLVRQVDHQLAVVGGDGEVVPGEGLRRRAGDDLAVARVLRAVARADEAVGQRASARRPPPSSRAAGSASARTVQPRCVQTAEIAWKILPSRKTNSRCVGQELQAVREVGGQARASPWSARRRRRSARSDRSEAAACVPMPTTPAPMPSLSRKSRRSVLRASVIRSPCGQRRVRIAPGSGTSPSSWRRWGSGRRTARSGCSGRRP